MTAQNKPFMKRSYILIPLLWIIGITLFFFVFPQFVSATISGEISYMTKDWWFFPILISSCSINMLAYHLTKQGIEQSTQSEENVK